MQQPENVLNQGDFNVEFLQADHTMLHPNIIRDIVHEKVIRRELTAEIHNMNNEIIDMLDAVFKELWGTDIEEWKQVPVYDTMLEVTARASNRVLVGLPLCESPRIIQWITLLIYCKVVIQST
jgi:hypothetical protein